MRSKQSQPDRQSYRTAILRCAQRDQAMRQQYLAGGGAWDVSLDADSTEFLRTIVAAIGWPTLRMVGSKASTAAWLLLQHSPDIDFMEHCLELMKAAPRGEVALRDIAFLEDRVCLLRGRPQIYGSQFQGRGKTLRLYPVEDAERLDERRAAMGLLPFAEYEKQIRQMYGDEPPAAR